MTSSALRVAADLIVLLHAAFVLFVLAGGPLALRWRGIMWVHVPAAVWGIAIEFAGWVCPLTPLENYLRRRSGLAPYAGDFIEHYIVPLLYPPGLTRGAQVLLGTLALAVNGLVYWQLFRTRHLR